MSEAFETPRQENRDPKATRGREVGGPKMGEWGGSEHSSGRVALDRSWRSTKDLGEGPEKTGEEAWSLGGSAPPKCGESGWVL